MERHFLDLTQRYGDVVAVDLTDKASIFNYFIVGFLVFKNIIEFVLKQAPFENTDLRFIMYLVLQVQLTA